MSRGLGGALVALALYAALIAWLTWPLAAHLGTHLPQTTAASSFDPLLAAWTLSYQSHTLTTSPTRFGNGNIFYPEPHAVFYGDPGFGALPYFLPTFLLTGNPALALNLTFLGCIALTAWTLHLVTVRWTGSHLAGFIAGWTLLMNRSILWDWIPGQPYFAVLQYFPLIVYLTVSPGRELRLLPLVALQCLTSIYVAMAVLVPLGLLGLVRAIRPATRRAGLRLLAVLALASLVLLPVFAGHWIVRSENPLLAEQTLWRSPSQPPTSLPWAPLRFLAPTAVPIAALVLIAIGALGVAIQPHQGEGRATLKEWLHCAFWVGAGLAISMTPTVYWYGTPITLPHLAWAQWLGVFDAVRVPVRLSVAALMGLCLLAGLAFAQILRWIPDRDRGRWQSAAPLARSVLLMLVAVALYAQYAHAVATPAALRLSPLPSSYPLQEMIARDSPLNRVLEESDGAVVELPVATNGVYVWPYNHVPAMYRSIFHWRPLLNGYSGYWPARFPDRMRVASRLPDLTALDDLRRETGLETILVHTSKLDQASRAAWSALAQDGASEHFRLIAREADDLLFAVGDRREAPRAPAQPAAAAP